MENTGLLTIVLVFLWRFAYIWIPIILFYVFFKIWIRYVNKEFIDSIDWAMLEIKVSRTVHKSPAAMEMMLHALHDTGGTGDWYKRWWKGQIRLWFSLEIISVEGSIYFLIRTPRKFKDLITSHIYSQYPQVEIQEVDDYTRYIPKYTALNEWSLFGTEMVLTKADAYPIKTYIDYGMDKDLSLEEEQRLDPMTPLLEFISNMRSGEHVWIQIMVRAATKRNHNGLFAFLFDFAKGKEWTEIAEDEIKDFLKKHAFKKGKDDDEGDISMTLLTPGKKRVLEALERSISKHGFDAGIRWIYMAPKDKFRSTNIGAMLTLFRQYNSPDLNGFKPTYTTDLDFPWQDFKGRKLEYLKESVFEDYVRRSFFYPPYTNRGHAKKHYILTTEELATIFHFPSRTAETPSFERIESKKGEPPVNLPT